MISFPLGKNYSQLQLLPFPTQLYTSNFSDIKTTCSSPTARLLPYILCLCACCSGDGVSSQKMPFHPQVLAQEWILLSNLPWFPQANVETSFQKHSLPTPQEPTSPFYPLSHFKSYFFKCLAWIRSIWEIRLVLFVFVYTVHRHSTDIVCMDLWWERSHPIYQHLTTNREPPIGFRISAHPSPDKLGVHPRQFSLHLSTVPTGTLPSMNRVPGWPIKPYSTWKR